MTAFKRRFIAAACVATFCLGAAAATPGFAADPEKVVKARQGFFQLVALNAGTLFAIAKGEMAYDAGSATTAANNLVALTSMNNGALWQKGTSKEEMPGKTRALMKIWDSGSMVGDKYGALKEAVTAMAEAAQMDADAIKAAAGKLGGACKGCHDDYRAEDF